MSSGHLPRAGADLADTAESFRRWMSDRSDLLEPFRIEVAEEIEPAWQRFRPLQRLLWDDGWTRLGWPEEFGGLGGTPVHRFVVFEELAAAGYVIPEISLAIEIIAPMLVRYAPRLAAHHVGAGVAGDEVWCQGFSEPDAGSDLGSLRTRAVPDGDGWRLTGQKMWSSNGHIATWSCVLAVLVHPTVAIAGSRCSGSTCPTLEFELCPPAWGAGGATRRRSSSTMSMSPATRWSVRSAVAGPSSCT